jgi:pectate lyase
MRRTNARHCLVLCISLLAGASECLALAFPGAEGYGARSLGGRGGKVIFVTSLADSGPGTLRAALAEPWPRTVIFRVGGTITLESPLVIKHPYVTVAGQTAPGGGIQIRNNPVAPYGTASDSFSSLVIATHDVVIRYLRIRPGPLNPNPACRGPNFVRHPGGLGTCVDANDIQAIQIDPGSRRLMLDHLSLAWASDEMMDLIGARNVTVQWSILAEGMNFVLYDGYVARPSSSNGHGVIIGQQDRAEAGEVNGRLTFHHNLFALLTDRTPQVTVNCPNPAQPLDCALDLVNNYVYGWRKSAVSVANALGHSYVNIVGNYFRAGPDTLSLKQTLSVNDWGRNASAVVPDARLGMHLSQNLQFVSGGVHSAVQSTCGRWNHVTGRWQERPIANYSTARYATPPITTTDAVTARNQVLATAGASGRLDQNGSWRSARDGTDARVVTDAGRGTGRIVDSFADFPGWPSIANGAAPADHDRDGMPDAWEDRHCLDATRADHTSDADADGYTNLEEFLNGTAPCG